MLICLHSFSRYLFSVNYAQGTVIGSRNRAGEEMRQKFYGLLVFITMGNCSFTETKFKQQLL